MFRGPHREQARPHKGSVVDTKRVNAANSL